ncbi:MAG: S46 family peptidase [Myxococcota bacterium]
MLRRPLLSLSLVLAVACGGGSKQTKQDPKPAQPPPEQKAEQPPPKPAFENPGGMWTPQQLAEHAETLKGLGLEMDPALLTDPMSPVLGAVVSLGGCSASFVSPQGLLVTNHHCVQGALQFNATPEKNLIKDGFLAAKLEEEKSAGPAARVFVTTAFNDVTEKMVAGIDAVTDDQARYKEMEKRLKDLVATCEKDRPGIRCNVARYYEGAQYLLIEQMEIRDVRLVYAPNAGVGNYGGEVDNWRWPRHTGDFSFLRAYVGPDGKPADHAPTNVPYKPQHFLKLATKPLQPGDLVFVAGYPGRTNRLKTANEVKEAVEWEHPRRIAVYAMYIKVLEDLAKTDKEVAIRGNQLIRGLNNASTNIKGQLEGLTTGGVLAQKQQMEAALVTWIDQDPERKARYGAVFERMNALHAEMMKTREQDATVREVSFMVRLLGAASQIVRMAEERAKPDAERHPDYQERNWKRMQQGMEALDKSYNRTMDKALLTSSLTRILSLPEAERSEVLKLVLGKAAPSEESIKKAVDALYAKPTLEDVKVRVKLLTSATTAELKKSKDPLIALALAVRPLLKAAEDRGEKLQGAMALVRPKYIEALRAAAGKPVAPDANGTLRITYGTVRGYRPKADAEEYKPFTTLTEVVAKNKNEEPFQAPQKLLEAVQAKKYGPYTDVALNDVPVDFLADLDITGGNSGSATLNGRGELVGLAFDGNIESMASDWVFMPSVTRSIHVDARYMAWVMDTVDGADHLLTEMGLTPAVQ